MKLSVLIKRIYVRDFECIYSITIEKQQTKLQFLKHAVKHAQIYSQ